MVKDVCDLPKKISEEATWTEIETPDRLNYKFFPTYIDSIQFQVKAASNAHIAFTSDLQESGPINELIIGERGTTKCLIRTNRNSIPQAVADVPGLLNKDEYRGFWVSWRDGVFIAGREGNIKPFIAWTDPKPFHVFFIGVCTGYGATGYWKIEDLMIDEVYNFFPVSNGIIRFKVKTSVNAQVLLTSKPRDEKPVCEVFIGAYQNHWSVIQRDRTRPNKAEAETKYILSKTEFRGFWVSWVNGVISAGREGETKPFLTWTDPDPFPIFYAGFYGYYNSLWKIEATLGSPQVMPPADAGTWVDASDGIVPINAVVGGYEEDDEPTYIARARYGNLLIPGKLVPSIGKAVIPWGGTERFEENYQVLVDSPSNNWVITSGTHIPLGAFPGGVAENGEVSYIGRTKRSDGLYTVGRVPASTGGCHVSYYDGQEHVSDSYEILMA